MESALYGIFTLVVEVSEISLVRCAHSFDFRYFTNSCENPVRARFPWSNLYIYIFFFCHLTSTFYCSLTVLPVDFYIMVWCLWQHKFFSNWDQEKLFVIEVQNIILWMYNKEYSDATYISILPLRTHWWSIVIQYCMVIVLWWLFTLWLFLRLLCYQLK